MTIVKTTKYLLLILIIHGIVHADVLKVLPYAQWTFDKPMEQIIFREDGTGFPIGYIVATDLITRYDSTGNIIRQIPRDAGDRFKMNENQSAFMLVQDHSSIEIEEPKRLYSFQVYDSQGNQKYTLVHGVDLFGGELDYKLTNERTIVITEKGQPWVLELSGEDTLLYIDSCIKHDPINCTHFLMAEELKNRDELVTATTCTKSDNPDSSAIEVRLWRHDIPMGTPLKYDGILNGISSVPGTDYFFLEVDAGLGPILHLYDRDRLLAQYPWKTWDIRPLGQKGVFIISEKDLNVINLGDGSVVTSYHPIDLAHVSDAAFLTKWGLFLYIRYETYFTETGQQAYRKFELEGVNKTGRIAHRSSFGSWSTSLPKISQIGEDLFAIHIHNAVLLYRVELERN